MHLNHLEGLEGLEGLGSLKPLEGLEAPQGLESLEGLELLEGLESLEPLEGPESLESLEAATRRLNLTKQTILPQAMHRHPEINWFSLNRLYCHRSSAQITCRRKASVPSWYRSVLLWLP